MTTTTLHYEQDQRASRMARDAMVLLWQVRSELKDSFPDALRAVDDQITSFLGKLKGLPLRKQIVDWPVEPRYPTEEQIRDYTQRAEEKRAAEATKAAGASQAAA